MTRAEFDDRYGGDVGKQAATCFRSMKTAVRANGGQPRFDRLLVEVARLEDIDTVSRVRDTVLGSERFGMVCTRVANLPAGQLVRLTATDWGTQAATR